MGVYSAQTRKAPFHTETSRQLDRQCMHIQARLSVDFRSVVVLRRVVAKLQKKLRKLCDSV